MMASKEMVETARAVRPDQICLVPERRQELTTEGGLDAAGLYDKLRPVVDGLRAREIPVSLFIEPEERQVNAAELLGADAVELHTGAWCEAAGEGGRKADRLFGQLGDAAAAAAARGLDEAVTWSFVSEAEANAFGGGAWTLANPISEDMKAMRPSLLPGLLAAVRRNADRGAAGLRLFELGRRYLRGEGGHSDERLTLGMVLAGEKAPRGWATGKAQTFDAFDAKAEALAQTAAVQASGQAVELLSQALALKAALHDVGTATQAAWATGQPAEALANAVPYLQAFGHTVLAWIWLDVALARLGQDAATEQPASQGRLGAAQYFFHYELPKIGAWLQVVSTRDATCAQMPEDAF